MIKIIKILTLFYSSTLCFFSEVQAAGIDGVSGLPTYEERQKNYLEWVSTNYESGVSVMGEQYIAWWLLGDKQRVINWLETESNIANYIHLPGGTDDDNNQVHKNWRRSALERLYYIVKDDPEITEQALTNLIKYATYYSSDYSSPIYFEDMNYIFYNVAWSRI